MFKSKKVIQAQIDKVSSIRNQPIEKHVEKIKIIRNAVSQAIIDGITHKYGKSTKHSYDMVPWIDEILTALKKINFNVLDDDEVAFIFDLLYDWIPLTTEKFLERYLKDFSEVNAMFFALRSVKFDAKLYLYNVVNEQKGKIILNKYKSEVADFGHPTKALKGYVKNVNPEVFPKIVATDYRVTAAIEKIRKLWVNANSSEGTTIEDEFFLEQVVTAYLPESHNLFLNFEKADAGMKKKAIDGFLEQMSLIEDRLKLIINTKQESDMKALTTHTLFLRSSLKHSNKEPKLVLK